MRGSMVFCFICMVVLDVLIISEAQYVYFEYPRYPYKKKQKNERKIKKARSVCENQGICKGTYGVDFLKCLRQCMSISCYNEIYASDELEEGEIDVRYNSFKGCLIQK